MKVYVLFAVFLATLVAAMAAPSLMDEAGEVGNEYIPLEEVEVEPVRADRHRRVTCDLLSFNGVVGDSACAANCLSMGKAGGRCNGSVCQCRKTTFKELWDKRFG